MENLKFLSFNCRGLNNHIKRRELFSWLKDQNLDVIFLQETFCTKKLETQFKASWRGEVLLSLSDSCHSRGVAILFRENMEHKILSKYASEDGRIILANVQIKDAIFSYVSVYAPNNEEAKINFINNLKNIISSHSSNMDNLIIGGDFNCCLSENDRYPPNKKQSKSDDALKSFLKQCNLNDCWKYSNSNLDGYTYYDKKTKTYSRLDYFFASEKLIKDILNSTITQPVKNPGVIDHNAIKLVIKCRDSNKGPGYWKLNNKILADPIYTDNINKIIENVSKDFNILKSHQLIWELLKMKIKEYTMHYCKMTDRNRVNDLNECQKNSTK